MPATCSKQLMLHLAAIPMGIFLVLLALDAMYNLSYYTKLDKGYLESEPNTISAPAHMTSKAWTGSNPDYNENQPIAIATVASKWHHWLYRMYDQAVANGYGPLKVVYGDEVADIHRWGDHFGLKARAQKTLAEQAMANMPNAKLMFVDAYDVYLVGKAEAMVEEWRHSGADLLFAAEAFCHPFPELTDTYASVRKDHPTGNHVYLNSGAYVGNPQAVVDIMTAHPPRLDERDQGYWTDVLLTLWGAELDRVPAAERDALRKLGVTIALDSTSAAFATIGGQGTDWQDVLDVRTGTITVRATGTKPLVVHFNGSKHQMYDVYEMERLYLGRWRLTLLRGLTLCLGLFVVVWGACGLVGIDLVVTLKVLLDVYSRRLRTGRASRPSV